MPALAWAPLVFAGLGIAGCAHRDVVDTPVAWWHQLQGGAIAQQRPPPPGVNDPYPRIGTTPAHAPPVASLDLRRSVTAGLLRQRNLATRENANDPLPQPLPQPALPRPAPSVAPPTASAAAGGSPSATLDAAQAPSRPGPPANADAEPELALPAVVIQPAGAAAVALPPVPGAPPPPPHLPGLSVAAGLPATERAPAYAVAPVTGTAIAFAPGTDSLLGGQQGALHAIAVRRGSGAVLVHGHGDAAADDPQAQAQALSVASLRARAVAQALQSEGVPARSILLQAEAFGRGAEVSLIQ